MRSVGAEHLPAPSAGRQVWGGRLALRTRPQAVLSAALEALASAHGRRSVSGDEPSLVLGTTRPQPAGRSGQLSITTDYVATELKKRMKSAAVLWNKAAGYGSRPRHQTLSVSVFPSSGEAVSGSVLQLRSPVQTRYA
jgi:hypothetical protein